MIDRPDPQGPPPGRSEAEARMAADLEYSMEHARRVPIPRLFQKSFDGPFKTCIGCAEPLEALPPYLIVKEIRGSETIVEYAVCASCHQELEAQYSEESRACINALFRDRVDFRRRFDDLIASGRTWKAWVETCILTGERRTPESEFQAVAFCYENDLILSSWPYIIAGPGLRMFEACLSPTTLELRDRFIRQRLGLPSIFSDHPATRLKPPHAG
ncbi:hypothetical protein KJ682_14400 [bacterium]|nr:hypothetical protein [bacterium]